MSKKSVFVVLAVASVGSAHAIVLDNFSDGLMDHTITAGAYSAAFAATVPGGQRVVGIQVQSNPLTEDARARVVSNSYRAISGPGADSIYRLGYGQFMNLSSTSALNWDGTATPRFELDFAFNDVAFTGRAELYSNGSFLAARNSAVSAGSNFSVAFDFSGENLTDVDTILFKFDPVAGGDFVLNSVEAVVPEPATLAVLGLGAAALIRRSAKKA